MRPILFPLSVMIAAAALAPTGPATAGEADWSYLARSADATYYLRFMARTGPMTHVWLREERTDSGELGNGWIYESATHLLEIDCAFSRARTQEASYYALADLDGPALSAPASDWSTLQPGTIRNTAAARACARDWPGALANPREGAPPTAPPIRSPSPPPPPPRVYETPPAYRPQTARPSVAAHQLALCGPSARRAARRRLGPLDLAARSSLHAGLDLPGARRRRGPLDAPRVGGPRRPAAHLAQGGV